jgi:hypothetical protein
MGPADEMADLLTSTAKSDTGKEMVIPPNVKTIIG